MKTIQPEMTPLSKGIILFLGCILACCAVAAPVAVNDQAGTLEDTPIDVPVLANDTVQGGYTLTVTNVTQPLHGSASINPNQTIRYTPAADYFGADNFTYTASDGVGGFSSATVFITVLGVNDPPLAPNVYLDTPEDKSFIWQWGITRDKEGDLVTLQSADSMSAQGGIVVLDGSSVLYIPATDYSGPDSFRYVVTDDGTTAGTNDFKTATGTIYVTILAINDRPALTVPGPQIIQEDTSLLLSTIVVSDSDVGGAAMQLSLSASHGRLAFASTKGLTFVQGTNGTSSFAVQGLMPALNSALTALSYIPDPDFYGVDSLLFIADDLGNTGAGTPLTDRKTIQVTVTPINDPPVVLLLQPTNQAVYFQPAPIFFQAEASDVEGPVTRVGFYAGVTLLGWATNQPFALTWTNAPAGTNHVFARAFDQHGLSADSAKVFLEIKRPAFILTDPEVSSGPDGSTFTLSIDGTVGDIYAVEVREALGPTNGWSQVETVTNETGTVLFSEELPPGARQRYYRAVLMEMLQP